MVGPIYEARQSFWKDQTDLMSLLLLLLLFIIIMHLSALVGNWVSNARLSQFSLEPWLETS